MGISLQDGCFGCLDSYVHGPSGEFPDLIECLHPNKTGNRMAIKVELGMYERHPDCPLNKKETDMGRFHKAAHLYSVNTGHEGNGRLLSLWLSLWHELLPEKWRHHETRGIPFKINCAVRKLLR